MYRYAQIDIETGIVVSDSHLSGIVEADNMIPISEDFDLTNKKYVDGEWVEYEPEPQPVEPTEEELFQAEILLNQMQIINTQAEQDEVLAEILLNQNMEV